MFNIDVSHKVLYIEKRGSKIMSNSRKCFFRINVMVVLLFLISGSVNAATPISSCTTISSPGTYVLNQSITNSNALNCIQITSSDVIFDGAGYTIDGIDAANTNGIYVFNVDVLTNVIVINATVNDWKNGIYYGGIINGNIASNNASSNINGIYLSNSGSNTLTGNNVLSNSNDGIYFGSSSNNILTSNNANYNSNSGLEFVSNSGDNNLTK